MHRDMGLYDDRLADLSEPRQRVRRASAVNRSRPVEHASRSNRRPTDVQSLLFDRGEWTESKARSWAQAHGFAYGKVDVTDRYIRIRQFDPKGFKVKRTIPFGRGIRAVVAREDSMRTTKKAPRRRRSSKKKKRASKSKRRSVRANVVAARKTRRRRRRVARVEVNVPRRRRRRSTVMEAAPRRRRSRRRKSRRMKAWRGNPSGHARAARKGWRKRKSKKSTRRRRRVSASVMEAAPRRRRRRRSRRRMHASSVVAESSRRSRRSSRRRSRRGVFEASRGGMGAGQMVLGLATTGLGFVFADGLDRFLATYNPAGTGARPKDKFTSDGAGTLANALNVASRPGLVRIGAGVGAVAVPALAGVYVRNQYARVAAQGLALGASVSLFKTIWNSFVMPLLKPKDTSVPSLQKSYIARLYPAEVAATINMQQKQQAVSGGGAGALSGPDVGPFALASDSPYPDTAQALRTGVHGDSPYPDTAQALRTGVHGDSPYPSAGQALRREAGMSAPSDDAPWNPGPPASPGPGPQPQKDCGCVGEELRTFAVLGDAGSSSQEESFVLR